MGSKVSTALAASCRGSCPPYSQPRYRHTRREWHRGPRRPRSRRARPHRSDARAHDAGQRAEGSGVADRAEGDHTWGLHRHLERSTLGEGRPRRDLRHQVRPPVRGVRAGGPEAADGRDDQRGMLRAQLVARDAEALQVAHAVALDHHVRRPQELHELLASGLVVTQRDGALVRVQVDEPLGVPALRITRGGLDLDHVGTEVGEHLGAVRPRRFGRHLDDRDVTEELAHGRRMLATRRESRQPMPYRAMALSDVISRFCSNVRPSSASASSSVTPGNLASGCG